MSSVAAAIRLMKTHGISQLPVLDQAGGLHGIISESDLLGVLDLLVVVVHLVLSDLLPDLGGDDLLVERGQRLLLAELAPGGAIQATQFIARQAGEHESSVARDTRWPASSSTPVCLLSASRASSTVRAELLSGKYLPYSSLYAARSSRFVRCVVTVSTLSTR
mgnify:CR=1 FL=1